MPARQVSVRSVPSCCSKTARCSTPATPTAHRSTTSGSVSPAISGGRHGVLAHRREVAGVTAACMLTPMSVFDAVGGFTTLLPGNYNDVDYCMKLRMAGWSIVYEPAAVLYHFESQSQGRRHQPRRDRVDPTALADPPRRRPLHPGDGLTGSRHRISGATEQFVPGLRSDRQRSIGTTSSKRA